MIDMKGITFRYTGAVDGNESLRGLDLKIERGECVLLTGKSGCGKTTLTRVLNGLCPQFYGGTLDGKYFIDGRNAKDLPLTEIGRYVGSVFQDPRSQFFCTNTTDEVVFSMESRAFPQPEMERRLEALWDILPIQDLMNRRIFNLSSGEKQKIAIASVCVSGPKVLVLDEPSANLDADATEQLATLLFRLKQQGHTIIISEHRIHYLTGVLDRMLVMDEGQIAREYSREAALSLTQRELKALGLRKLIQPILKTVKAQTHCGKAVAAAENLSLRKGNRQILQGLNMQAYPGEILAVTGSNGAGKTTLCKLLTGAEKEMGGTVCYGGKLLKSKERIRQSFLVQQDADYQLYSSSVSQELILGLKEDSTLRSRAEIYLEKLGLLPLLERHPASLSGGQKQRVLIAAAMLRESRLLALDEPTSGLDGLHMQETAKLFKSIAARGRTIILITHDMELIESCVTRVYHIQNGSVSASYNLLPSG